MPGTSDRQYDVTTRACRQPEIRWLLTRPIVCGCVRGQRLSAAETEAKLRYAALRSRIISVRAATSLIEGAGERKPQKEPDSGSRRARIRCSANLPGGRIVRTIGIATGESQNRLQNLAYNIRRLVTLERMLPHEGVVCPVRIKRDAGRVNAAAPRQNKQ